MLLPDVLLADEDQVTRSEHPGNRTPSLLLSIRPPAGRPATAPTYCRYALVSCCRMSHASLAVTASASWAACRS